MSGEEDLYLNQSEAEALFFSDALLGNADELDFESFGDASGLDDGTFNGITGSGLTAFETRDIFKSTELNGGSFVDSVEAKCEGSNSIVEASSGTPYNSNGTLHHSDDYVFTKPTLDLESMGMAYDVSGLYLQGNGVTTALGGSSSSPSGPAVTGLLSPSIAASEKLNGLTLEQMAPTAYGMAYSSAARAAMSAAKQFMSSAQTTSSPVAQVLTSQAPPANGMSRFGSHEMLMVAAADGNGVSSMNDDSASPVLSPSSSDGNLEHVETGLVVENGMKASQSEKQYYGLLRQENGVDTADFGDQVDGDGDGLQPLPQMTRSNMQRSYSSHALGQLRHVGPAPRASENGSMNPRNNDNKAQVDRSSVGGGLSSPPPGARLQGPSLAEFHGVGSMRPMMRRVYSAGDIQTLNGMQGGLGGSANSSPSFDDGNYRVGKYSMEERKIRIHRYQQKRTQRNFNKKIKYACRKTLADSRPRVRGRFAKNMDDELPVAVLRRKREDDDDEEGDAVHGNGDGAHGFLFENSSGEYSDMLMSIKKEHRTVTSM